MIGNALTIHLIILGLAIANEGSGVASDRRMDEQDRVVKTSSWLQHSDYSEEIWLILLLLQAAVMSYHLSIPSKFDCS